MALDFQPDSSSDKLDFQLDFQPDDSASQIPGLERSVDPDIKLNKREQSKTALDKARELAGGIAEATVGSITGIPTAIGESFAQQFFDKKPGEFSRDIHAFQPSTEKGEEFLNYIGEQSPALMGGIGHFTPPELKALDKTKDATLQKVLKAEKPKTKVDFQADPVQRELFEIDNQPKGANKYEAQEGYWTVDENGIPIRADLSMEAQNLQTPLQRNLWGDELPVRENPVGQAARLPMDRDIMGFERMTEDPRRVMENDLGITQAIDKMPDLPWKAERDAAIDLLKGEIDAPGELKAAKMEAEIPQGGSPILGTDSRASMLNSNKQRGAINPEVFKEGFQKLKQLADGTWLRAHSDGQALTIDAHRDGHIIGSTTFDAKYKGAEKNAEALMTSSKHPGMATEMYRFASELGNDISKSDVLTQDGRAMWDRFEQKGFANNGVIKSPGNRQRGAFWMGEQSQKKLEKVVGKRNMIPDDPNVKEVLPEIYGEKDSNSSILFGSGAILEAMKRRSTAVLLAARLDQNAQKRSDLAIRKNVHPVEKAFRELSRGEFEGVSAVLKHEMLTGERFSPEALSSMSVKQQVAYAHMRKMFEDTLRIQNEARATKGQKPITEMEAYLSSRWDGAYRRPVFQAILDKDGNPKLDANGDIQKKLVWYLAADTKRGLEKQSKALQKEHPDFLIDPKNDHMLRHYKKQTDLQSALTTMIDGLGRDDPAVTAVTEIVRQQTINEAASFLGQEKHFKEKVGVRGFVGDRPGKNGFSESLAMIQQQIQYAKNAYKWSEMQKAGQGIKELLSDPRLKEEQPNNMKYVREYFKNSIGHGEAAAVAHMADSMREMGFNIDAAGKFLGGTKTYFILSKLAVSTGNAIVNMIQFANIFPHLMSNEFAGSRVHIPSAIATGVPGGVLMALGHYAKYLKETKDIPQDAKNFYMRAFQYAEDNGITSRSIYDESPVESSFSPVGRTANILGRTISTPETFTRSIAYSIAVQFLKETGKYTKDIDLFQKAEEMTNAAMVDYRQPERPMAFAKLGAAGNFLNTLQTYPLNWYNQWNYFAREGMKGNIAPFMAAFALQYALAGAMGVPYFNDMDKLYMFFKEHLPAKYYAKVRQSEFWDDPKLWVMRNFGTASIVGVLSDKTGLGLTTRLATPGMEDMIQAPIGPAADILKQGANVVKMALNPNRDTAAQVAMSSSPVGLQGLAEYAPQFQGSTFEKSPNGETIAMRPGDIESHTAVYRRGITQLFGQPVREDTIRKWGLRSTKEMIGREVNYRQQRADQVAAEKARSLPEAIYAAAKRGNMDQVRDLTTAYAQLTGTAMTDEQWDALAKRNFETANERQLSKRSLTPVELLNFMRAKAVLDQVRKEQTPK